MPNHETSQRAALQDEGISAACQRLTDANAAHAEALGEAAELTGRISAARARHDELVRQRIAGTSEGDPALMHALDQEAKALDAKRAAAQERATDLLPTINAARRDLQAAERLADKTKSRADAERLAERCRALDAEFMTALRECQAAAARAGMSIASLVRPSIDLTRFVQSGAATAPFARR
jgi:chromosome segregation ATPase